MVLRWWMVSAACVIAMPSPSEACSCNHLTDPEYVENAQFAFDGTVLGEAPKAPPKRCTEPTKVSVRPGCLEIGVFDPTECTEIQRGGYVQRAGSDDAQWFETTYGEPEGTIVRARLCKLATGTYTVSRYNGPPRTIAFDAEVGGSVMLYAPTMYNAWRIRVRVDTPIKGELPREVFIRSSGSGGGGCGIDTGPAPGERLRFFVDTFDGDTDLGMNACSGWHDIDDTTPKLPRVVTQIAAAPPSPPTSTPPPVAKKSSGCSAGGEPGLLLGLLAMRRACRRARRRSRRERPRSTPRSP